MKTVIDQGGGIRSVIAVEDDKLITGTSQDCEWILDRCAAMRNEGMHGSKEMRLVADIPVVTVETYCNLNGITLAEWYANPDHIRRMVNDPDLSKLRIAPGRV